MLSAHRTLQVIAVALLTLPGPALAHDPPEPETAERLGFLSSVFQRGRLGVEVLPMTSELRAHFGLDPDAGVLVSRVRADGPAAEVGIKVGDVIVAADGGAIRTPGELARVVDRVSEGETLALALSRQGERQELEVTPRGRTFMTAREGAQILGRVMVSPLRELREQIRGLEERLRALEQKLEAAGLSEETQQT